MGRIAPKTAFKKGHIMSEEVRKKISITLKGRPSHAWTKESREKARLAKLGKSSPMKGKKHSESTIEKIRQTKLKNVLRGEKNHRWIKDRTKLKTDERKKSYDTKYKYWMLEVKKRDKWKCRLLNDDCSGRLESHHILNWIEFPELRYEINNGITLCHFHHPKGRKEEKRLSPYFKDLLAKE